jgi:hypothetical protein
MGIHSDGLLAISIPQDDVGRFPAHAGKGSQVFEPLGDLAMEFFYEHLAATNDVSGLVVGEARGTNFIFKSSQVSPSEICRLAIFLK